MIDGDGHLCQNKGGDGDVGLSSTLDTVSLF